MPKSASSKKTAPKRTAKQAEKLEMPPPPTEQEVAAPPPAPDSLLPVVYDALTTIERSTASPLGPWTVEDAKDAMGWETEKQYQKRMVDENPGSKPTDWLFGETGPRRKDNGEFQPVHCLDASGQPVVCWNNAGNRPFDLDWAKALIQTILYGQWAGPHTIPGGTVNGETIRISRYGRVLSAQHTMSALILADEFLLKARNEEDPAHPRFPFWVGHEHPFIETLVVVGVSEHEAVLRTIDYNKPRTSADMLYTMPLFRTRTPGERREMTRILSTAIETLWQRTAALGYGTHPELCLFLERHKTLLKCVEHIFAEDGVRGSTSGRRLSRLHLNTGVCAALCYLMGCGSEATTDISDEYRNDTPPTEAKLDWSLWDRALDFWALLASSPDFDPVRRALGRLKDSSPTNPNNIGLGGRADEKLALLAKAWEVYKDHPDTDGAPFELSVLALNYNDLDSRGNKLPPGEITLIDRADFLGIDCPKRAAEHRRGEPPAPTHEEIWGTGSTVGATERLRQEAAQRRAATGK